MARVLIGVDGSELAREAARRATDLLGDSHEVTIAEVVRPTVATMGAVPASAVAGAVVVDEAVIAESIRSMVRDAEAEVAATVRDLGLDAATRVVTGDPGDELCRLAREGGFDLLVVGSHGSGFFKRVLLGSVSHHVLHHAPCPVLVVRDADDGEADVSAGA